MQEAPRDGTVEPTMLASPARTRRVVERVPVLFIGSLERAGALPPRYNDGMAKRQATLAESSAISWLVEWDGFPDGHVYGYAGYIDRYDPHGGEDVREVVVVEGSARACATLVRWIAAEAADAGRTVLGTIDVDNDAMQAFLERLGYMPKRVVMVGR